MPFPGFPKALEKATWESGRAKLTPSIGITEELVEIKKSFGKIKQDVFEALEKPKSAEEMEVAFKKAKTEFAASVKPYHDDLLKFARFAEKKAAEAKKSATFPGASRKLIEAMANTASDFAVAVRDAAGNMQKAGEKALAERVTAIQRYGQIRTKALEAATGYEVQFKALEKQMDGLAKTIEKAAADAVAASKAGNLPNAAKAGQEATKAFDGAKRVAADAAKLYDKLSSDASITDSRQIKPDRFKLVQADVAQFGDKWNKTVDSVRVQTRVNTEIQALIKEVALDASAAQDAASSLSRSADEWAKTLEATLGDARKEMKDNLERVGGAVLRRAEWLKGMEKSAATGNPEAVVKQASAIVDEIESNTDKTLEIASRLQRLIDKRLKTIPDEMAGNRVLKSSVDEARMLAMRATQIGNKVRTDGAKIVTDYRKFIATHGG
jgi:hypothetical protein